MRQQGGEFGGKADVGRWREGKEPLGRVGGKVQADDEVVQAWCGHALSASEVFEPLVRVVHARDAGGGRRAHHGLDRLGKHFPVGIQVGSHRRGVYIQAGQAAAQVGDGQ